jgi:hypothetical protein
MEANKEEIGDEEEADWYLRRMDAGLSSLQNADYILGWVCMEDDGVSCIAIEMFHPANTYIGNATCSNALVKKRSVLQGCDSGIRRYVLLCSVRESKPLIHIADIISCVEFARNIGDEPTEGDIAETQEDVPLQKIVIHQLVQFLEGCDA